MSNQWVNMLLLIYPIGAIYTTTDSSIDPAIWFGGGTWEKIDETTVGSDTVYRYKRTA